jgi:hypothetical protein
MIETPKAFALDPIAVGAKILWCTPANSPDEFWAGLETIDIDASGRASLNQLLERLSSQS